MDWSIGDNANDRDYGATGERWLMQQVLPQAKLVLDVGACVGDWTREALKWGSQAEYHLFEPHPHAVKLLELQRWPSNVRLHATAISNKDGVAQLCMGEVHSGLSSLYPRGVLGGVPRGSVPTTSVDAWLGVRVADFVKLDIEGAEFDALCGMRQILAEGRVRCVQFEYGGAWPDAGHSLKELWQSAVRIPLAFYRLVKLHSGGCQEMTAWDDSAERYNYANWALVRRDAEWV